MPDMTLRALYNAGLYLRCGETALLVDALHGGYPPYEAADASVFDLPAQALLFTHRHPDHYNARMVFAYLQRWPEARVYGAGEILEPLLALHLPASRLVRLEAYNPVPLGEGIGLCAWPTRHMGAEYRRKEHMSLLLRCAHRRLLLAGDAAPVHNNFERDGQPLGRVETLIAPYAYALYEPAQRMFARGMGTDRLIVNHIPVPDEARIRERLYALDEDARSYRLVVAEKNKDMEVF